jgi:hypothetical protein
LQASRHENHFLTTTLLVHGFGQVQKTGALN